MSAQNGSNGRNPSAPLGAQGEEMGLLGLDHELDSFARDVRAAFVDPITPELAERQVAAMVIEAERVTAAAPTPTTERLPIARRRWSPVARVALVASATVLAVAGMAVAGVRPPEPISDALEALGVDVPGSDARDEDDGGAQGRGDGNDKGSEGAGAGAGQGAGGAQATNDGETPGAEHANENAAQGQETAAQARSGETPPDSPGRSDDHPESQGGGTPPEDPGAQGQGKPDNSPPAQGKGSSASDGAGSQGLGIAAEAKPDESGE